KQHLRWGGRAAGMRRRSTGARVAVRGNDAPIAVRFHEHRGAGRLEGRHGLTTDDAQQRVDVGLTAEGAVEGEQRFRLHLSATRFLGMAAGVLEQGAADRRNEQADGERGPVLRVVSPELEDWVEEDEDERDVRHDGGKQPHAYTEVRRNEKGE